MSQESQFEDDRLEALLARATVVAGGTPTPPVKRQSRRRLALAAVVVSGLAVIGGATLAVRGGGSDPTTAAASTTAVPAASSVGASPSTSVDDPAIDPTPAPTTVVVEFDPPSTSTSSSESSTISSTIEPPTTDGPPATSGAPATTEPLQAGVSSSGGAQILSGTPAELLPGGQPWPNGLYVDAIMYMRGTVPDEATSKTLQARVEQILGADFVRNDLTIDPTVPRVETVIVRLGQSVLFKPGSDEVNPEYYDGFALWAAFMQSNPQVTLTVIGHTDDRGSVDYNMDLAQRRAESARRQIMSNGVDEARVSAVSVGFDDPIASNDTSAGRTLNRRIEFAVTGLFAA